LDADKGIQLTRIAVRVAKLKSNKSCSQQDKTISQNIRILVIELAYLKVTEKEGKVEKMAKIETLSFCS